MPQELFHIVEMERRLRADQSGQARSEILKTLRDHQLQLKQQLMTGLNQSEFKALTALKTAIEQAEIVIESYWLANHQN